MRTTAPVPGRSSINRRRPTSTVAVTPVMLAIMNVEPVRTVRLVTFGRLPHVPGAVPVAEKTTVGSSGAAQAHGAIARKPTAATTPNQARRDRRRGRSMSISQVSRGTPEGSVVERVPLPTNDLLRSDGSHQWQPNKHGRQPEG